MKNLSNLKFSLTMIIIGILVLLVGFGFALRFDQKIPFLKPKPKSPNQIWIPLPYNNPFIDRAAFGYGIRTTVEGVEERLDKTTLKTSLQGIKKLPELVIDNNTMIFEIKNNTPVQSNKSVLISGSPIYIYLVYDLKSKKWSLSRITVLDKDNLPEATQTGQLQP